MKTTATLFMLLLLCTAIPGCDTFNDINEQIDKAYTACSDQADITAKEIENLWNEHIVSRKSGAEVTQEQQATVDLLKRLNEAEAKLIALREKINDKHRSDKKVILTDLQNLTETFSTISVDAKKVQKTH